MTTTVAEASSGVLHLVTVNKTDNTVTISDATGTLAVLKNGIAEDSYIFDIAWVSYLKVVTAGTPDLTVAYSIIQV